MNDLEHEIRDTLRRHEGDAPASDPSDARRAADRTRHRQIQNVAGVGVGTLVVAIALVAGLGGLVRADRSPTVLDTPSPSQSSPPGLDEAHVYGWPETASQNPAGVYSWDRSRCGTQSPSSFCVMGLMHNGQSRGRDDVYILFRGVPGRLIAHRGRTAVTVAGYEGSYRRFIGEDRPLRWMNGLPSEEWMVDIRGTTVTILLVAEPGARATQLAEAHEIIGSIRSEPMDTDLGFRLDFTLATNGWDSG